MSLWPFRTGNDERFQSTARNETIYDAISGDMPRNPYAVELNSYLEWRWRRGLLQSVVPATFYSALIGFAFGFRQSRVEGRYIGRYRVMWRYTSTFAGVGLLTTAVHHVLVVWDNYHDRFYYPIIAGAVGAGVLTVASRMGSLGHGLFVGSFVGVAYAAGCIAVDYYRRRHLRYFLQQQQLQQVPVHKVSPELQPMYRAYLYDYRPLEEVDKRRREAVFLSRFEDDTRLDAQTFLQNSLPEVVSWVNFPDWWPLKLPAQTEEEFILEDRLNEEAIARRHTQILAVDDGALLRHQFRTKSHREPT